jgi:hypothetical protein
VTLSLAALAYYLSIRELRAAYRSVFESSRSRVRGRIKEIDDELVRLFALDKASLPPSVKGQPVDKSAENPETPTKPQD